VQESTQNLLRLVHDAAFETALKGQFDDEREAVESILQSALNILERTSMGSGAGLIGKP
jgi:hypothetical protein|tara:strand:- start:580 stop:756 length:177 start_codon:yes stop_codon:yes gene_type:complete